MSFILDNQMLITLCIYFFIYVAVFYIKPKFIFNKDGHLRYFGVGDYNKTILPLWLFSIVLGILSYMLVLYISKFY